MAEVRLQSLIFRVYEGISMANPEKLGEEVKRYGYSKNQRIKLCGKGLELVSDPVNMEDDNVFVDAREDGTDKCRFRETS